MTGIRPERRELGPEPRAFLGLAFRIGPLLLAALLAVAFPLAGLRASLAVSTGGLLAGLAIHALARGLEGLLQRAAGSAAGRLWALGALVPRQGLLGAALFVAVAVLKLPAGWLLAGVSVWPLSLTAAGVLLSILPTEAALGAAGRKG